MSGMNGTRHYTPSHGHGPRHYAWEGCRTMYLYQELSLGGGSIALGLPRLLFTRPPSRIGRSGVSY